jgi:cyclopropane-fatty-acyl-phospholipid synthase
VTTIAHALRSAVGDDLPVRVSAFDGSVAGPDDAVVSVRVANERALRRIVTAPGPLGLARAYVAGDLELEGDIYQALSLLAGDRIGALTPARRWELLRTFGLSSLRPVAPPEQEVGRRWGLGRRHARRRDAAAISHHYDVSNRFYELVLGPSMAYTCAVFPTADASLEQAQWDKHDLVARKLALAPGMRLLDVGCGWGGMVRHAAREYGVRALGVTLSRQQAEWAQKAIAEEGLTDLAEVRHCDYRDVTETGFDAVSSIGLTEHIGRAQLAGYVRHLAARLRPQGRLLNHCIMRPTTTEPALTRGGFIDHYVFPDGELSGLGPIVAAIQDNGFEVRHEENLREHYALTLAGWCANLSAHWDEAVAEVGLATARVWMLYLAGSRLGFEQNRIQLHQVLGVRTVEGQAGFPLRPAY